MEVRKRHPTFMDSIEESMTFQRTISMHMDADILSDEWFITFLHAVIVQFFCKVYASVYDREI